MITHTIHLVRHGQCKGNVTGEILPPNENLITDFGIKQAEALGEHLKDVEFTMAIASTYERAIETAKIILSKSLKPCPVPLKIDPHIREREMIGNVGHSRENVDAIKLKGRQDQLRFSEIEIPGFENQTDFTQRIRIFFKELFDTLKGCTTPETILIVSHGLTMQRFLIGIIKNGIFSDLCLKAVVLNWEHNIKKMNGEIRNTADTIFTVTFFEQADEKPTVHFLQVCDTEHLKALELSELERDAYSI